MKASEGIHEKGKDTGEFTSAAHDGLGIHRVDEHFAESQGPTSLGPQSK